MLLSCEIRQIGFGYLRILLAIGLLELLDFGLVVPEPPREVGTLFGSSHAASA
jgi:hypothetical protein